jgi:hypothetical protein
MNKKLYLLPTIMLLALASVSAASGSIWTTLNDCGASQQDINHYAIGDNVFVNGNNFDAGAYSWSVKGQPGQASCDPNAVVANGTLVVGQSGAFCFNAYTVQANDCGEYKVDFGNKNDNYRVDDVPSVPEFGMFAASLTILGALGAFFLLRRK